MSDNVPPPDDKQPHGALEKREDGEPVSARPEVATDAGDVIQGIPVDVIEKLPPELKKAIISFSMDHRYVGPPPNPIAGKITAEHITKLLESSDEDSKRDFEAGKSSRRYYLCYVVLALIFLSFLTIYLPSVDKELYKDVLKFLVGLLGGFGAGFGAGQAYSKRKS